MFRRFFFVLHVQPAVVKALLKLNCVPVFLSEALTEKCYNGYCKGVLWPVSFFFLIFSEGTRTSD